MNKNWKQMLQAFVSDESGQDMIEYALVAALIGLAQSPPCGASQPASARPFRQWRPIYRTQSRNGTNPGLTRW